MSTTTQGLRIFPAIDALKVHESLFALPFTYTSLLIAGHGFPTARQFVWITLAMLGARNFGMAMNRIIDKNIDALHPVNRQRHLPSGRVTVLDMMIVAAITLLLFVVSAAELNLLSFVLSLPSALYLVLYSYSKRFTWLSNIMLGAALAIGPAGAWVGITGTVTWQTLVMAVSVVLWAGAFDMVYHIPSRDFYLEHGLLSIPRKFGARGTLTWARLFDAGAVAALVAVGIWERIGYPYFLGLAVAAAVLVLKHWKLSRSESPGGSKSFFRYNVAVSATVLLFTLLSYIL